MKNIKSIIGMILASSLLLAGLSVSASNITYEKEVIFEEDSIFTEAEKEIIIASVNGEHIEHTTYGLKCVLFGHTYKTEIVTVITHKERDARPRCLEEIFEWEICEECSDRQTTLIGQSFIDCCE
ncbi:MAG: hypothetical protein E7672_07435 [Ruminococcaceae bacterium]|nr:hypothetical protein [Oscillospiraceae bacterium]